MCVSVYYKQILKAAENIETMNISNTYHLSFLFSQ